MLHRTRNWLRSDMKVLRWVLLALYLMLVTGLSLPFLLSGDGESVVFWLILGGAFVAGQLLLILGAGTIHLCLPIRRRRLWMPALAAGFMFAVLVFGLTLAICELVEFDPDDYGFDGGLFWLGFWAWPLGNWVGWGVLLWAYAMRRRRVTVLSRFGAFLFAGSLAELLACVPSHMIVSKRPGCIVGLFTMLGIIAGVYVMLFSFGPMIVVLFLRPRYRREQMEGPLCPKCEYDLRGTIAAGRTECPECGEPVPAELRLHQGVML